jgi:nucleotide-binding universal stress UspA family protein
VRTGERGEINSRLFPAANKRKITMLNHVLVPLDGSPLAEQAIAYAKQLVDRHGKITLITALDLPESWFYGVDPMIGLAEYERTLDQMMPAATTYLERIASTLRAEGYGTEVVVEYGKAASLIVNKASAEDVDVIVMSTHGRSGFSKLLFGSVTNKVLTASVCPVFVVPSRLYIPEAEAAASNLA